MKHDIKCILRQLDYMDKHLCEITKQINGIRNIISEMEEDKE